MPICCNTTQGVLTLFVDGKGIKPLV